MDLDLPWGHLLSFDLLNCPLDVLLGDVSGGVSVHAATIRGALASRLPSPLVAMMPIPSLPLFGCPHLVVRDGDGNDNAEKDDADGDDQQCEQPHHGFKKSLRSSLWCVVKKHARSVNARRSCCAASARMLNPDQIGHLCCARSARGNCWRMAKLEVACAADQASQNC
jgi:hypothetical protein